MKKLVFVALTMLLLLMTVSFSAHAQRERMLSGIRSLLQ